MIPTFLWYLASPYSHDDAGVREERYKQVVQDARDIMDMGLKVFIPISHSHQMDINMRVDGIEEDIRHDFMMNWDWPLFDRTDGLIVDMIPGWEESKGVGQEIDRAIAKGKMIAYYQPRVIRPFLVLNG